MNIYAHRGNSGFFPENTMYAFKKSLDLGIYGIEIDVQKTKDGILVVHHDETLGRIFDGKGSIKKSTFISYFNYKSLKRISKLNSKVKTAYLVGPLTFKRRNLKKILKICKDCKCTYIHPSCDVVNKEFVAEAHKRGLLVQVYTVNSVTIMKKLIKLKVDGVFTNYPKIINTLVNG